MGPSLLNVGPALPWGCSSLLQCPSRGRGSYLQSNEGWGQFSTTLGFQHTWFLLSTGNRGHGHHHRPQLQQKTLTQTGPWHQLWPRHHHGPTGSTGQISMVQLTTWLQTPTCSQVAVQTPGIHSALSSNNRNHGHQPRPWLPLGHGPTHDP